MLVIRKILVPTDYSTCAEGAFMHALHLARHYGAEVHLLHVVEGPPGFEADRFPGGDYLPESLRAVPTMEAPPAEEVERWNGITIRRLREHNTEPTAAILAYGRQHDVDLIVMGTHGNRSMSRFLSDLEDQWLIGLTAEQVIKLADRPVFTVGPRSSRMPELVRHLLVPVDFSPFARRTIAYARDLAGHYEAQLHFLHVVEEGLPADREPLAARLRQWAASPGGEPPAASFRVRTGDPAAVILEEAAGLDQGMIVLSSHGRKGLEHHQLGTEAERVVRAAPWPVFLDRAAGKSLLEVPAGGEYQESFFDRLKT
ncbi:MAG: universal stress protein [Rhodothermaceae bacterium]|nr:MAG: universal stress protein [Rhodothermaceae bacterium]